MEICRLCNVSNPRGLFYQIFDNPQTNPTIPEIVEMLADVKIVEDDPYTKMICFNCYNVLITIHKYRERILETNRSLKKSFHENSALICYNEKNEHFEVNFDNSDADSDCEMNLRLGSDSEDEDNHCSSTLNEDNDELFKENNVSSDEDENHQIDNNHEFANKSVECAPSEIKIVDTKNSVADENNKIVLNGQNLAKKYECDICGKKLRSKVLLIRHFKLHRDKKLYKCHFCNREFTQKANLTGHLKQHTGEKPYICNICDKRFTQKSNLNRHLKIHTDEKRYTCNFCDKRFIQKSDLNRHLKTHRGEKPFTCKKSGERFPLLSNLKFHVKKVHKTEKPNECCICHKKFAIKLNLNKGLKQHTGDLKVQMQNCN